MKKKKNTFMKEIAMFCIVTLFLIACKDTPTPTIPNEEELITTLELTLTSEDGKSVKKLKFKDIDGDGGSEPTYTLDTLMANTVYNSTINLLNESGKTVESISDEIAEELEEHQFFYQVSSGLNLSIAYSDKDANGKPVGVTTKVTTKDASKGNITITLKHLPNKSADGVADGKIANAGGETDIEVNFSIIIK